jgi:hypothetical protein
MLYSHLRNLRKNRHLSPRVYTVGDVGLPPRQVSYLHQFITFRKLEVGNGSRHTLLLEYLRCGVHRPAKFLIIFGYTPTEFIFIF